MKLNLDFSRKFKKFENLTQDQSINNFIGDYMSVFKGSGIEFDSYQEYYEGSDAKKIDWIASSRTPKTLIKQYVEERNISCYFLFDTSSSMLFTSTDKLKCEYAAELIASFAFSIISSKDNVGLAMFNDKIRENLSPASGKLAYFKIIKALSEEENYAGKKNIVKVMAKMGKIVSDKCLLFIVSDLAKYSKKEFEAIKNLTGKFEIIVLMIRDPVEIEIPKDLGLVCLQDPFNGEKLMVNFANVREEYNDESYKQIDRIRRDFMSASIDFCVMRTDLPVYGQLMDLFNMRRKRWS
jgi:uncharacterized protein (DUF58 family)